MIKEGIDMFISGEEWEKARHVAKTIAPRYYCFVMACCYACNLLLGLNSMWKKLILIS